MAHCLHYCALARRYLITSPVHGTTEGIGVRRELKLLPRLSLATLVPEAREQAVRSFLSDKVTYPHQKIERLSTPVPRPISQNQNPMDASPFSLLPQELRDHIYTLLFTTTYATTLATSRIQHPLTRTCRQLRNETLPLHLSLTRFNAHLDDGPATPLAQWLQTIGPAQCLRLREVNIWDLHMLNGSLHGVRATERMLASGPAAGIGAADDEGEGKGEGGNAQQQHRFYVLKPVGRDIFHGTWYLKDIVLALQDIGLMLQRFCEVVEGDDRQVKQTSHFAIQHADDDDNKCRLGLAAQFGLSDHEREDLAKQLNEGKRLIQLHEGRRNIFLAYDEARRLVAMRQQFIPRDEEFYM